MTHTNQRMWHAQGPSSRKMSLVKHKDEQRNADPSDKAMCTHGLIWLPRSIGGSNEEIDHHPVAHVKTVFHRPIKKNKKKPETTQDNIIACTCCNNQFQTTTINWECVWAYVTSSLKHWKTQEVLLHLCSKKGSVTLCVCVCVYVCVCACVCTVDGSSSRTRCGTGWRWWRASWAPPRRPRLTDAPTDHRTGSAAVSCPAGWGLSITETHKTHQQALWAALNVYPYYSSWGLLKVHGESAFTACVAQLAACSYSVGWYLLLGGTRLFINLRTSQQSIVSHTQISVSDFRMLLQTCPGSEQTPEFQTSIDVHYFLYFKVDFCIFKGFSFQLNNTHTFVSHCCS